MNQGEWQTVRNHDDYEIWSEHPYPIRKKSNHRVVSECLNTTGYYQVRLSGILFCKHKIIVQQWLRNLEGHSGCNHINRIISDNRIENLRWCSGSDNHRN